MFWSFQQTLNSPVGQNCFTCLSQSQLLAEINGLAMGYLDNVLVYLMKPGWMLLFWKTLSHMWANWTHLFRKRKEIWLQKNINILHKNWIWLQFFKWKNVIKFDFQSVWKWETLTRLLPPLAIGVRFYIKHQAWCLSFNTCLMNKWKSLWFVELLSLMMTLQMEMSRRTLVYYRQTSWHFFNKSAEDTLIMMSALETL